MVAKHLWPLSGTVAYLPLIHVFRSTPRSRIFAPQVIRSLITPAYSVSKRHQLICSLLHIRKKRTPRPLAWMSFTLTLIFLGKYGDFDSWQKAEVSSLVKRRKREEGSKEEATWPRPCEKITVWAMLVLKDWLEDLNFSGRLISCVLKNVLFNVFIVGFENYISPLKNTMTNNK